MKQESQLNEISINYEKTTVIDMSLISLFGPIMVIAAGALFLKEHITKKEKVGIFIAFLGVLIPDMFPQFEMPAFDMKQSNDFDLQIGPPRLIGK